MKKKLNEINELTSHPFFVFILLVDRELEKKDSQLIDGFWAIPF